MPQAAFPLARSAPPLLEVSNLNVGFETSRGLVRPVQDVSFSIFPGQTVALVGESGCGKSVTAMSILRLNPSPPSRMLGGQVIFEGRDLLELPENDMRRVRGKDIAMIFQEPMTSLNPVFSIGDQIAEAITLHQGVSTRRAYEIAEQAMDDVGISDARRRLREYPHEMSGGMRQRVMIAMALSCQPKLLIADEPTTALDVTIQAQILELLRKLQKQRNMSILLITHDLGVVAENADVVAVMYASRVVEVATVEQLFDHPQHPYTQGLFRSVPRFGDRQDRLETIAGTVPNPAQFPTGCKFHPRCSRTRAVAEAQETMGSEAVCAANAAAAARGNAGAGSPAMVVDQAGKPDVVTISAESDRGQLEPARVVGLCIRQEPGLREVLPGHWAACHLIPDFPQSPLTIPVSDHRREVVASNVPLIDGAEVRR